MRDAEYRHAIETAARLGAEIEMSVCGTWARCPIRDGLAFAWESCDYRVKPPEPEKPKGAREWWLSPICGSGSNLGVFDTPMGNSIHVREVLEKVWPEQDLSYSTQGPFKPSLRKPRECWVWAGVAYESRPGFPSATLFREVLE